MARNPSTWVGLELASGRYRITDKLGEGGMGYVYKASDTERKRHVVIKVPNAMVLQNEGHRKRFEREYLTLRKLSHPNVVKIYEAREARQLGSIPYAVMQYLAGGDLSGRLSNDPTQLRDWLPAIAKALDYVHQHQHIHRDVKPGNILFDAEGKAYLSDFGIIKIAYDAQNQETSLTRSPIGTPQYMAPEIHKTGATLDGRIDQYALAIIVYEALAGRPPFRGTHGELIMAHMQQQPEPIANLPNGLQRALLRGLDKDPAERFTNCSEFASTILGTIPVEMNEKVISGQWWILSQADNQQYGPASADLLRQWIKEGRVLDNTLIRPWDSSNDPHHWQQAALHFPECFLGTPHINPYPSQECAVCGRLVTIPPNLSGRTVRCPSCKETFVGNSDLKTVKPSPPVVADDPLENGPNVEYHENGKKKEESNWKNGKQDGLTTFWHDNGQKEQESHYKNGELDGLATWWYENGKKAVEAHFKNGEKDGLTTHWHENGKKKEESNWKNGEPDGLWTEWDTNGQKSSEEHYKNGELDGLWTGWDENGQKTSEIHYKDGKVVSRKEF